MSVFVATLSALGNWAGDMILYPLDTISTRLKANKYISHDIIPFIRNSVQQDGMQLYRGILRLSFPSTFIPIGMYVFAYEHLIHAASEWVDMHYAGQPNHG
jgi:hypothetical protein